MKKQIKKAIALKYEPSHFNAPHVIAKGSGYIADQIIEQAQKHDVKIVEDQALTSILYQLEIHEQIPPSLYPMIAEIFAFVYQAEQKAGNLKNG
ncbi:EscU/YscU/HrcU family type III secretion system export apparatus switch protein [Tepidibacillus decaturensis]|uniref:FhlB domain-containing protein n=1 Tax=Tepidibacillus decaturensis TaxID=1413211 RepID=A0A135L3V7_9BACI|nr:EscU/YscU/HrcU family type III secretion system export apparatus switch protein [Tepidibacillus decaturensis]KXG43675.1 FhlB domain-containing protein [Tepidibacillus decaturensis]